MRDLTDEKPRWEYTSEWETYPSSLGQGGRSMTKRVVELLASHLLSAGRGGWPGTDGLTITEVVAAFYRTEAHAGRVPSSADLVGSHPEMAEGIEAFFGQIFQA